MFCIQELPHSTLGGVIRALILLTFGMITVYHRLAQIRYFVKNISGESAGFSLPLVNDIKTVHRRDSQSLETK